jgi:hypothetical protein
MISSGDRLKLLHDVCPEKDRPEEEKEVGEQEGREDPDDQRDVLRSPDQPVT